MVPNIDKYRLLAGPWTEFINSHVWSFNQSQTRKSRADVWTCIYAEMNITEVGIFISVFMCGIQGEATTDLNTWIAGFHGFTYPSMRATESTSASILRQSKYWIVTRTSTHVSVWNATGERFLSSNFMKILRKKIQKFAISSRLLNIYWK